MTTATGRTALIVATTGIRLGYLALVSVALPWRALAPWQHGQDPAAVWSGWLIGELGGPSYIDCTIRSSLDAYFARCLGGGHGHRLAVSGREPPNRAKDIGRDDRSEQHRTLRRPSPRVRGAWHLRDEARIRKSLERQQDPRQLAGRRVFVKSPFIVCTGK